MDSTAKNIKDILKQNNYAGRGIVVGKSQDQRFAVIAYFIMGRSENSRNRVFRQEGDAVSIYPYDLTKVSDPTLIIYSPVREIGNNLIVTNGDQTDTVFDYIKDGGTFEDALDTRFYEPDEPNYTPRISSIVNISNGDFTYKLSILKKAFKDSDACAREFFSYESVPGKGHFIHTYEGDGNPLPTFSGEPREILIPSDIDEFTNEIWSNLNGDNKISLFVKYVDIATMEGMTRLINKNV